MESIIAKAVNRYLVAKVINRYLDRIGRAPFQMSMGGWDGVDHYWPTFKDFENWSEKRDRWGHTYEAMYQYDSTSESGFGPTLNLFVDFDAAKYVDTSGSQPIKWEATFHGSSKKGTVRKVEDIRGLMDNLIREAKKVRDKIQDQLSSAGGTNWDTHFDGYELSAQFHSPHPESEASMTVVFDEPDEVLFGTSGEKGNARIWFSLGSDYEGHFGKKEVTKSYKTTGDVEKVLKEAEKLFDKWYQEAQPKD